MIHYLYFLFIIYQMWDHVMIVINMTIEILYSAGFELIAIYVRGQIINIFQPIYPLDDHI